MASGNLRFKAFISYSHSDKAAAAWLHRALETYRVPKRLVGRETQTGLVSARLGKIFRDRDELAVSADLTGEINDALKAAQFLIVLCSPASAKSQWVNQEVINFKRLKGEGSIICVIVEGEPFASGKVGEEERECFVPALRFHIDDDGELSNRQAEPIAADLRPHADGKRLATLKVIAGLLGCGLDELVQRENQRRQRRLTMTAAGSIVGMLVMTGLTWNAISAQRLAEQRQTQAEGFVEYMISDLRDKLEPIGRLDVLDSVSSTALEYYAAMSPDDMDADSLARRSRAFLMLGEIADLKGDLEAARSAFVQAKLTTEALLARSPNEPGRIKDHGDSLFWIGYTDWQRGQTELAKANFESYLKLTERLVQLEPDSLVWKTEVGNANTNLGVINLDLGMAELAQVYFESAHDAFMGVWEVNPSNIDASLNYASSLSWLAEAHRQVGKLGEARADRNRELQLYESMLDRDPQNVAIKRSVVVASTAVGRLALDQGELELASNSLGNAIGEITSLLDREPENVDWQELAAQAEIHAGTIDILTERYDSARARFRKAEQASEDLMSLDETLIRWQEQINFPARLGVAKSYLLEGKLKQAHEILSSLCGKLTNADSQSLIASNTEAECLLMLGILESKAGNEYSATNFWRRALEVLPTDKNYAGLVSLRIEELLHRGLGNIDTAAKLERQLDRIGYNHPERFAYEVDTSSSAQRSGNSTPNEQSVTSN